LIIYQTENPVLLYRNVTDFRLADLTNLDIFLQNYSSIPF